MNMMWLLIKCSAANLWPKLLGYLSWNMQYLVRDQNCLVTRVLVTVVILIFQNKGDIKTKTFPLLLLKSQETHWLMGPSMMSWASNLFCLISGRTKRKISPLGSCLLSHLSPSYTGGLPLFRSQPVPRHLGRSVASKEGSGAVWGKKEALSWPSRAGSCKACSQKGEKEWIIATIAANRVGKSLETLL